MSGNNDSDCYNDSVAMKVLLGIFTIKFVSSLILYNKPMYNVKLTQTFCAPLANIGGRIRNTWGNIPLG